MVREKIGLLQKFLASVGKRLLWWRAEKMDLYVLALMAREAVKKYEEILDGDLEQAVNTLKNQFSESARTYLRSFLNQLKLVISKDLKDMEFISTVGLYSILGKNYKKFFMDAKFIPADDPYNEDKVPKYVTISPKCLLCSVIEDEDKERYKDCNYAEIIPYALGSLMELIFEYVGHNYRIVVKETGCFLRGDPYSEIQMLIYEKEEEL